MKKSVILIFALTLILISLIVIKAEELGDSGLPPELEKIQDTANQVQDPNSSIRTQNTSYLGGEFIKMLEKNKFGSILLKGARFVAPSGKYIIGMEFGLSWLCLLVFVIWLFFLNSFYNMLSFSIFSKGVSFLIGLGLTIVLGITGTIKAIGDGIASLLTTWWVWLIAVVVLIAIIFIEGKFGKVLREKRKKAKEEMEKMQFHYEAQVLDKVTKPMSS